MTEPTIEQTEAEYFTDELSDEALDRREGFGGASTRLPTDCALCSAMPS